MTDYIAKLKELREKATDKPWRVGGEYKNNVFNTQHITRDVWHIANCLLDILLVTMTATHQIIFSQTFAGTHRKIILPTW